MQDHTLEYIRRHVVNNRVAALLIGPRATHELRELYPTLSELEHKGLVEANEDETQFWTKFLGFVKGEDFSESGLERSVAVGLVEVSLKGLVDHITYSYLMWIKCSIDMIYNKKG